METTIFDVEDVDFLSEWGFLRDRSTNRRSLGDHQE